MIKIYKEVNKQTIVFDDMPISTQDFMIDYIKVSFINRIKIVKELSKITVTIFGEPEKDDEFVDDLIQMCCEKTTANIYEVEVL